MKLYHQVINNIKLGDAADVVESNRGFGYEFEREWCHEFCGWRPPRLAGKALMESLLGKKKMTIEYP